MSVCRLVSLYLYAVWQKRLCSFVISDTLRKDGKIGVVNSERLYTETGEGKNITGYVYLTDPKEPGKLTVHLQGTPADLPCKFSCGHNINNS